MPTASKIGTILLYINIHMCNYMSNHKCVSWTTGIFMPLWNTKILSHMFEYIQVSAHTNSMSIALLMNELTLILTLISAGSAQKHQKAARNWKEQKIQQKDKSTKWFKDIHENLILILFNNHPHKNTRMYICVCI